MLEVVLFLADEAADDGHSLTDLEGDDLLFHELDPVLSLSGKGPVLSKLEENISHLLVLSFPLPTL